MNSPLISLKTVDENGKKIRMVVTRKIRRIYSFLKADKTRVCIYKLSVRYGVGYKNQGVYKSNRETIQALKAFTEK